MNRNGHSDWFLLSSAILSRVDLLMDLLWSAGHMLATQVFDLDDFDVCCVVDFRFQPPAEERRNQTSRLIVLNFLTSQVKHD